MENLAHSASFHSGEKIAPSKSGIKHSSAQPPDGEGWLHEIKHDGHRLLAIVAGDELRLISRNGHDRTALFRAPFDKLAPAGLPPLVLDGEIAVPDERGVTHIDLLTQAMRQCRPERLASFAFVPRLSGPERDHLGVKLERRDETGHAHAYRHDRHAPRPPTLARSRHQLHSHGSRRPPQRPPSKRLRRYARNKRAHALLRERWSRLFTWGRPLAIGIDQQISEALGDQLDRDDLRSFRQTWTRRPPYVAALARGYRRVNLDMTDAGHAFCQDPAACQAAA